MSPSNPQSDDPHRVRPDDLPTPFTAAEIRRACEPGRTLRFRVDRQGEAPGIRVSRYVSLDAEGAIQESWTESPGGERLSAPESERSSWLELQEHASFPAASTALADEVILIPAGRFACLRYTRNGPDGTWRFWFARDLPGQPIRYEHEVDGVVTFSSTLVENVSSDAHEPATD